jgi:TPR repeat protein
LARSGSAWSVKGIDSETRGIARARAAHSDLTIGAWIDQAILAHAGQAPKAGQNNGSPKTPPRSQNDSRSLDAPFVPAQDPIHHKALLDLVDGELAASHARLDQSLRPLGFALKDLALKLVAAESLSRGRTAGPTSQRPEIGSRPDSNETSGAHPQDTKTWPEPPKDSLAPPMERMDFQPVEGPVAPPPPTGDLGTIITSVQPGPANLNRLDAGTIPMATHSLDLDGNPARPSPIPPTGNLGLVHPATMPSPPIENAGLPHAAPDAELYAGPQGAVSTPAPLPELGSSAETSENETPDVRFTGLQDAFESDPDLPVVEARAASSRTTIRFLRIAAGLLPFLILASVGSAYFLADQLGFGAQRDRVTNTISNHVRGSEKTIVDAYQAAVEQVRHVAAANSGSTVDLAETKLGQSPTPNLAPPPNAHPAIVLTPKIEPGASNKKTATTRAPTPPRNSTKISNDKTPSVAASRLPSDDPPVAHLGYQNAENHLKSEEEPALPATPKNSVKHALPIPDKAVTTASSGGKLKQRENLALLPKAPALNRPSTNNESFTTKNSIKVLRQQARAGDAVAQHELARRLIEGDGIKQDFGDGSDWFREAAIQGMANAQYNLGVLYERGLGVTKDDVRALLWYHSAAEQSHPLAQYNLGIFYLQGRGIPLSYAEAVRWFRAASDQGVAKATYNLAVLTEDGLGVRPDKNKAMGLYEKAASRGHHEALNRLTLLRDPNVGETKPATFEETANTQGEGGSTGTTVADIQAVLRRDGIYAGRIDGVAGPKTRTAIREYQRRNALPITGIPSILLLDYMKTSKTKVPPGGSASG